MTNLLEINGPSKGRVTDPSFIYIEDTVKKYTNQLKFRIDRLNRFVKKDHLLYKLITLTMEGLPLVPDDDEFLFFDTRRAIRGLSTSLNLTYLNNYGKLHYGSLIPGTKEAIVITAKENLKPITILYHNHYNVNWELGNKNFDEGFAIIELNIFAIMKLYYEWRAMKSEEDDIFNFIYKKLIYSMIDDYMDIALYNRHIYTRDDVSMPEPPPVREYRLPNIGSRIDKHVQVVNTFQDKKRLNITGFLEHIELFHKETALDLVPSYPTFITHQARWVYSIAKLPYIIEGLKYASDSKSNKREINRKFTGQLKRFVRNFKNQNPLSPLPQQDQAYLLTYLDSLDQILTRY